MDIMKSTISQLITKEACFPALKLVWDKQIEPEDFGELPKITPTHYLKENRLTTEERYKLLCRQQKKLSTRRPGAEVVVEPPIIVFQNYKFGETYTFPIVVRNISKNSQKVAILMDESYVFKFDECSQRVAKFPCGMCITAAVTFTPENPMEDYYHKLVVSTNRTKVVVPIIGIGPRPLLNAPDSVLFKDSPVRYWAVKPVNVLNIGKKPAKFTLAASGTFCVKPEKGIVQPNEAFTFEVAYYSSTVGTHEGEVCIRYDNGEEIYVYLRANAVNSDIKLSTSDIRCEDTFITLQTRATFYIENNSNVAVKFYWKTLPEYDDMLRFYGRCDECPFQWKDGEGMEDALEKGDPTPISYGLFPECEEILKMVKESPDNLFVTENFQLYPLFGEIKPRSKTEMHVIFSPTECAFYEGHAYLEINGLEKRVPFTFHGRGLGPKFKLGFEILNVSDVALGGTHTYEVPVQNVSEIPGIIRCDGLVGQPSGMGMKVEPSSIEIAPDQFGAFYVMFACTGKPGPFEDEIKFVGQDSGDTFYVTVTGTITYPSIRFTQLEAHVGNISYGFPKTFSLPLVNDSLNYVNVIISMESDGTDPPIDYNTILSSFNNEKFSFDNNPSEFKIHPVSFTLKPRGVQRIELTIYPNQVREIKNKLRCLIANVVGNVVEQVASVNIRGAVVVPTVLVEKDYVYMKDCYLHYPYPSDFVIRNPTELPVVYCVIYKHHPNLEVVSNHFVGVAEPWVETLIPFDVISTVAGESVAHFDLYCVGREDKIHTLTFKMDAIPSKVEASTKMVDFGKIEVFEEKLCSVDIVNTSPVEFPYTASIFQDDISDKGEIWGVEPESGILPSQSRISFSVMLFLKEIGWHYSGIRIQMNEPIKHTIEVKMKALGVGSPLQFTPSLETLAELDFGITFIKIDKMKEFEILNRGVNPRVLEFRLHGEKGPSNRLESKKKKIGHYGIGVQQEADNPPPTKHNSISTGAGATKGGSPTQTGGSPTTTDKKGGSPTTTDKKGGSPTTTEKKGGSPTTTNKGSSPTDVKESKKKPNFTISPTYMVIPPGGTQKLQISAHSSFPKKAEELWNLWTYVPATKAQPYEGDHKKRETVAPLNPPPVGANVQSTRRHSKESMLSKSSGYEKVQQENPNKKKKGNAGKGKGVKPPQTEPQNLHLRPVVLTEVHLVAQFETPGLKFSKDVIKFVIEASPTHENFIANEILKIENVGALPLKVKLKTKFPFTFRTRHETEDHEENTYDIGIMETLMFKIKFDGQHLRKELGTVVFDRRLDATCEGLPGVNSVQLIGEVKFPELTLERTFIDFGTITNGMEAVEQITVTNEGNFCLTYKWYMKPGSTKIEKNDDQEWAKDLNRNDFRASINANTHLKVEKFEKLGLAGVARKSIEMRRKSREMDALRSRDHFSEILGIRTSIASKYEDFTAFVKEKMYRSRMMEFMGLKDAEYEAEDEVNYLAFYNQNALLQKDEYNTNELIDVIPLAGVVQAGQSQTFTFVFYGYPDIVFNTTLVLYVEGGARKNVYVRGSTIPPSSPVEEPIIIIPSLPEPVPERKSIGSSKGRNSAAGAYSDNEDDAKSNATGNSVKTI